MLKLFETFHADGVNTFEVVVMDNSDENSLKRMAKEFSFNLKYFHSNESLSVVENFNRGVGHVTGEYACFIGDDDLISKRIFDLINLMKRESIDSAIVSPKTRCVYYWPGVESARWGKVGGNLYLSECTGEVHFLDVQESIESSKRHLCDGPQKLPRAYSGIISKQCIDAVVLKYGELFGGVSPDIYSSRLLATIVKRHVAVDMPILVAGASKNSTSAARSKRSDVGELRGNDLLERFKEFVWSPVIPKFYSPFTVWAQSYSDAEIIVGQSINTLSLTYLYAKCIIFSGRNTKEVLESIRSCTNKTLVISLTIFNMAYVLLLYSVQKLPLLINRRPGGAAHCIIGLMNSFEATQALDKINQNTTLQLTKG